jgi:hypothetical protein
MEAEVNKKAWRQTSKAYRKGTSDHFTADLVRTLLDDANEVNYPILEFRQALKAQGYQS